MHSLYQKIRTRGHGNHHKKGGSREAKRRVRRRLDALHRADYGLQAGKNGLCP